MPGMEITTTPYSLHILQFTSSSTNFFPQFFVIFFLGVLLRLVNLPDSVLAYFSVNLIHMELSFTSCAVQHN